MRIVSAFLLVLLSLSQVALAASHGTPWANTGTPLGMNLTQQAFSGNGQQPWLNIMKSGGDWITAANASVCFGSDTNEETLLYASFLDANGYPTTLTGGPAHTFTKICTVLNQGMGTYLYPAGNYTLTLGCSSGPCSGAGNVVDIGGDATASCDATCNFNVTPSGSGIQIAISAVNSGNYVNSISVVKTSNLSIVATGDCTAAIALGKTCFDPVFTTLTAPFSPIRFMQATNTITNTDVNWSDRPTESFVFWNRGNGFNTPTGPKGWPWEVVIGLCNQLNAACWVNEPCLATTSYATSMISLFASLLKPNLKIIPEFCNETWNNGQMPANVFLPMAAAGHALFPAGGTSDVTAERLYALQRQIDDSALWKATFGSRSIRLFGGWAGNNQYNVDLLGYTVPINGGGTWTGPAGSNFEAMATAPYYDIPVPSSYTGDADGGLSRFFCVMSDGLITPGCTGVMPTGAGASTTTGTSTAYVLSDGAGAGCPAAVTTNGYVTSAIFNVTNGTNPTIAVDGCSALPLLCDGNPIANIGAFCTGGLGSAVPSTAIAAGGANSYLLAYTTKTSAGTVTTGWRIVCGPGVGCMNTTIGQSVGYVTVNIATAASYGLQLILYEGGWGFVANSSNDLWSTLYDTAALDPRAYQTTGMLLTQLRAAGLAGPFAYFAGFGIGGFLGENWSLIDNVYQTPIPPKYQGALDFIHYNPCWWANCRN